MNVVVQPIGDNHKRLLFIESFINRLLYILLYVDVLQTQHVVLVAVITVFGAVNCGQRRIERECRGCK